MTDLIISNTRITAHNTCTRQEYYMYERQIEPREYPMHIRRGTVGHAMLDKYYSLRQEEFNHDFAKSMADQVLVDYLTSSDPEDFEYVTMLSELKVLMDRYFEYYKSDTFKVLAVEKTYTAPIADSHFGLILDLLIERTTGPFRGDVEIWDHKFVNNFKSDDDLKIDGQQPKYMKTAQLNGIPARRAIFNQIRYRKMKDPKPEDLFRRSPLSSSHTAVDTIWEETTEAVIEIQTKTRPVRRTLSYSACKFCFFKDVCMAELAGTSVETMLKTNYKSRTSPLKDWMLTNG